MLTIRSYVWGVRDLRRSIDFWTRALDYRLREEPSHDWATLVPREGDGQQMALMLVSSPKPHRHHLDLTAGDRAAEIERLVSLGATEVTDWDYEEDADYIVLADPDGNTFCVIED